MGLPDQDPSIPSLDNSTDFPLGTIISVSLSVSKFHLGQNPLHSPRDGHVIQAWPIRAFYLAPGW